MFERKPVRVAGKQKGGSYELPGQGSVYKEGLSFAKRRLSVMKSQVERLDRTLKCRYEMKYVINDSKAAAIERFIKPYLKMDHYSKLQPTGAYPVVSLYLDSANLRLCHESLHGHKNRFKLRIRSYTDDPDYPRFFEIKRRMNTVIIKDRTQVMQNDIPSLLSGLSIPPQKYKTDENLLRQFQLYLHSIGAAPVVRIRYIRRAYEDDSGNRVRVTFDRQLCYKVDSSPNVSLNGLRWNRHYIGGVILEIKFTGRYPIWLSQMAACFGLRKQSMSKYATSVKKACMLGLYASRIPTRTNGQ